MRAHQTRAGPALGKGRGWARAEPQALSGSGGCGAAVLGAEVSVGGGRGWLLLLPGRAADGVAGGFAAAVEKV